MSPIKETEYDNYGCALNSIDVQEKQLNVANLDMYSRIKVKSFKNRGKNKTVCDTPDELREKRVRKNLIKTNFTSNRAFPSRKTSTLFMQRKNSTIKDSA